jgi:hypothetical protein
VNAITDEQRQTAEREIIEICFPGSVEFVVLARFTAATIGARAGFDLDEIDDLRLAVDELSVSFGPLDGSTSLRYEFLREGGTVNVKCTREPTEGGPDGGSQPQRDVINWQQARELSEQLLDELVTAHGRDITEGRSVAWLTKHGGTSLG